MPSQRVTQTMMNTQLLRNLSNNMRRMDDHMNQLSTSRRINKPSDDPVGISFSMRYRSELAANDQYLANTDSGLSWLSYADTTLGQINEIVQRARELAVKGANGTNDATALNAMKAEVEQLNEQLVGIGNTQFNGKYVFNGELTDLPPYTVENAMNEMTDAGDILFELGAGVKLSVNVTGNRVFGEPADEDNLFKVMGELANALDPNNPDGGGKAVGEALGKLDERITRFLEVRADIGAKVNRIELSENRLKDIGINLQSLQSKTEDADMAIVITNLKMDENVYQASLAAGSKLIRPSLLDFLT